MCYGNVNTLYLELIFDTSNMFYTKPSPDKQLLLLINNVKVI